ncbi:MAG: gamma-glutamyl-gamma-aminobutyrate hydrolase family protein [Burkholderiales bacterium]|nr:gamma-glutamyl-gamma-aminobutyrate hydrolase family protein [Burkholderiales bacterium]
MTSSPSPRIGITPDRSSAATDIEALFFVRRNYCAAISDNGGVPLVLPYDMDAVETYLDQIDGLLITGGMFDVNPALYGMPARYPGKMVLKEDRTAFEQAMLRAAIARDMPVLGICGGMQLIAVEMGAKLHQHIPSDIATSIEHKQAEDCDLASHAIFIHQGSKLHAIMGVDRCEVNSLHHQSVFGPTDQVKIAAIADDGVVEAIEVPSLSFCMGVQWHPEYRVNASEKNLFTALVAAARESAAKRLTAISV